MSETERVVSLDVGGMSIRSAVVHDRTVRSVQHVAIDNSAPADDVLDHLAESIAAHEPRPAEHIAIAVPDPFDHPSGSSRMEHKFAALRGIALRPELSHRLGLDELDIRFVNDAAAAGAGEAAGRSGRTLVLTLGTGLGAALIQDGALISTSGGLVIGDLWTTPWIVDGATVTADDRFSARGLALAVGVHPRELPEAIAGGGWGRFVGGCGLDMAWGWGGYYGYYGYD